jgi:hypothetical protein
MTAQLPTMLHAGGIAASTDTYIVPVLIANEGDATGWCCVEFFTANINNPHTR